MPSGTPEPVFTASQWARIQRGLCPGPSCDTGGAVTGVHLHFREEPEVELVADAEDAPVGPPAPVFAEIELLEEGAGLDGPVIPTLFVANGTSFFTSAEHPIDISPIAGDALTLVTVTFIAKSVSIRSADQN